MLKQIIRKIVLGAKYSSDSYISSLRKRGCKIGNDVIIYDPVNCTIDTTRPWLIEIGNHVRITKNVTILTHGYDWSVFKVLYGEILGSAKKIKIGNNVFIGMNATVLSGVEIGDNAIIGAGSVVTKSIPSNTIAAGNPARVICSLEDYHKKRLSLQDDEATQLTIEYYKTYQKWPTKNILREFIWLFEDRNNGIDKDKIFSEIGKLGNNFSQTKSAFYNSTGKYKNYEDFINHCKKQLKEKSHE